MARRARSSVAELIRIGGVYDSAPLRPDNHLLRRVRRTGWLCLIAATLLVISAPSQHAVAVVAARSDSTAHNIVTPVVAAQQSGRALIRSLLPEQSHAQMPVATELMVESGDTMISLLGRVGVMMSDAYAAVRALDGVFSPRDVRPGWTLHVTLQPQDPPRLATLQSIEFRPSVEREIRVLRRGDDDAFTAKSVPRPLHRVGGRTRGTIDNGLFGTAISSGVPQDLVIEAISRFSNEVDFQRDIRGGDEFEFVYDTLQDDDGNVAKSGDLHYAKLVLSGKEKRYYGFTPRSGVRDLFSPDGISIRKELLQTPVDATRISSTFGMRWHPVLGYTMMHRGVDFAAPAGTPVRAAGDGVVVVAGNAGSYGNYIRIRHTAKYSTAYAHLTSFARGVSDGVRVRQGAVIGYVGSTGRATGPHLHYEVMIGDRQVNPRGVQLPAGQSLSGEDLRAFKARINEIEAMRVSEEPRKPTTVAAARSAGCPAPLRIVPPVEELGLPSPSC